MSDRNDRRRLKRRLAALRPFAAYYADLVRQVERTSTRRLRFLVDEACDAPTETNCWWAEKHVSGLVRALAEEELGRRLPTRGRRV